MTFITQSMPPQETYLSDYSSHPRTRNAFRDDMLQFEWLTTSVSLFKKQKRDYFFARDIGYSIIPPTFEKINNIGISFIPPTFPDLQNLINRTNFGPQVILEINSSPAIIVARPLKELMSHIKHLKVPSFQLIARVIKTLVLGIFRWHLCDRILLKNNQEITHNFQGRITKTDEETFKTTYPFLLENAYFLKLKAEINHTTSMKDFSDFDYPVLSPNSARQHFSECYPIIFTPSSRTDTIDDLFKSQYFDLKTYQDFQN